MPLTIKPSSGSGSSTLISVAGTTTNDTLTLPAKTGNIITSADTGTVTQAMLSTNVAGNGPAFSAYLGSTQSISAGVYTKLQINTEEFDTSNCYDATTNYRFTPNVAGYYLFTADYSTVASGRTTIFIYKNGSVAKQGVDGIGNGANSNGTNASALIYANGTTDYFELYVNGNNAQSAASGATTTYFQAYLARSA